MRAFQELKNSSIKILYAIDKSPLIKLPSVEIVRPEDEMTEKPDMVIVTGLTTYDKIESFLINKGHTNVVGLDDLLYEMLEKAQYLEDEQQFQYL